MKVYRVLSYEGGCWKAGPGRYASFMVANAKAMGIAPAGSDPGGKRT